MEIPIVVVKIVIIQYDVYIANQNIKLARLAGLKPQYKTLRKKYRHVPLFIVKDQTVMIFSAL